MFFKSKAQSWFDELETYKQLELAREKGYTYIHELTKNDIESLYRIHAKFQA